MKFTDIIDKLFGSKETDTINLMVEQSRPTTDLTNPTKMDTKVARALYHNTDVKYKLAGQLIKPIVNNNVNFIGIPQLFGNKKNIKVIDDVKIDYRKVHKTIEIDGDSFIWPQWDDVKKKIKIVKVPSALVTQMFVDPLTKELVGYQLEEDVTYSTPTEANLKVKIVYVITADYISRQVTGSKTESIVKPNFLGEIPIVHFHNDKDDTELYGHSEFENILPQVKFYHDLTYEAGAAQSRDGHPKLKVTTKNARTWINNNFGAGSYDQVVAGKKTISMEDRDLFVNNEGDDVQYLYLNKTSGDYTNLSETAFTNIVEGSETPEINFGANIGTSLASVKEYRPVWIKKIESKQYERTEPWLKVYDIILAIHNFVNLKTLKSDITMVWPKPNFASVKEQSEIISAFAGAIEKLKALNAVTTEEVYDTLKELDIFEMAETFKAHQKVADEEKEEAAEQARKIADANSEESGDGDSEGKSKDDDEGSEDGDKET